MSVTAELANLSLEEQRAKLARLLRKKAQRSRLAPLSFAQERLWFVDQYERGTSAYNIGLVYEIASGVDLDALRRALLVWSL